MACFDPAGGRCNKRATEKSQIQAEAMQIAETDELGP